MGSKKIQSYLNKRMLSDEGWLLFCRLCGEYKLESEFYNSKDNPFGKTYKCKIHYQKSIKETSDEFDYLKMNPISDKDFEGTEKVLKSLGYKIGKDELPIWKQFEIKHKI